MQEFQRCLVNLSLNRCECRGDVLKVANLGTMIHILKILMSNSKYCYRKQSSREILLPKSKLVLIRICFDICEIVYHDLKIPPAIYFEVCFVKREANFGSWINL